MSDLRVDVEAQAVQHLLDHLVSKLSPLGLVEWFYTRGHDIMKERARTRFVNEGDQTVGQWAPLTDMTNTIRYYSGYPPVHPINVRSGQLRNFVLNSYTVKPTGFGAMMTMPGPTSGQLLNKLRVAQQGGYAGVTREGTFRGTPASGRPRRASATRGEAGPNRPAPARPVLAVDYLDAALMGNDLMDWIQAGLPV